MLIATAGHVDHGKTVLVKALTGVDTDRLPEEKARGLTIDLGFAYRERDDGEMLGFVDVPGHEKFVRNMLAGVAAIDLALLVVAADDGPMPQTVEHLSILDLLGIPRGAVALTKIDKVAPERVDEVTEAIVALLAKTRLAGAPVFPVSGLTGEGVEALSAHLDKTAAEVPRRPTDTNFRLAVDRSFTVQGAGLVVTGAVFSGAAGVGDRLTLSPAGVGVRIRGIHALSRAAEAGFAGQRLAVNIAGTDLDRSEVHRGDWLVAEGAPEPTRRIDARLRVLASEAKALAHWTPVHVHLGAASLTGRVAVLEGRSIEPGGDGVVQVLLEQPTVAVRGDRFILRDQSARRTIAGGTVVDPFGPVRGRARPERIAFLHAMEENGPESALGRLLAQEENGFDLDRFAAAWNLVPADAGRLFAAAPMVEIRTRRARLGIDADGWKALRRRQLDALKAWHDDHPDRAGPDASELRRTLDRAVSREIADALQETLIRENAVVRDGSSLRLPSHRAALSAKDAELWRAVTDHIAGDALKPPVVSELAERLNMRREPLLAFLGKSAARGQLVKVADNRFFHPRAVARLARIAEEVAADSGDGAFDAKAYRDASGIGRNLAIQVLEYFDNAGLTRRIGDTRKVVRKSEEVFGGTDA